MAEPSNTPIELNEELPEHYEVATAIVADVQEEISGTIGVLLTQAEVALANNTALKPYKDQIKREFSLMRNRIQDHIYYRLKVQDRVYSPGNVYLSEYSNN